MTATLSQIRRTSDEIVADVEDGRLAALLQLAHELQDARLHRHVERGRRLVGDQQIGIAGERLRDHDPLLHAAGKLVRIALHDLAGVRDLRFGERLGDHRIHGRLDPVAARPQRRQREQGALQAARALPGLPLQQLRAGIGSRSLHAGRFEDVRAPMLEEHLGDLIADRQRRVQRLAGVLEYHGDAVAADCPHARVGDGEQVQRFLARAAALAAARAGAVGAGRGDAAAPLAARAAAPRRNRGRACAAGT